jgi:hypothetical protein
MLATDERKYPESALTGYFRPAARSGRENERHTSLTSSGQEFSMSSALYRMPPLPDKKDYLQYLLAGPHTAELFVDEVGKPVLAVVMKAEHVSDHEIHLYQEFLRLATQAEADSLTQASRAILRDTSPRPMIYPLKADVMVDLAGYVVQRGNELISLRAREAELLHLLLRHPRTYISSNALAEAIGFEGIEAPEHSIEDMISQLRRKLGETPFHPTLIRCKRYAGYAIFPEETRPPSPDVPRSQAG